MENNSEKITLREILYITIAAVGVGAAAYCGYHYHKTKKMIAGATKHINDLTEVTVQDNIIENAVRMAVDREADNATRRVVESMGKDISEQTAKKVGDAVAQSYSKIKSGVAEAIAKKVADIDTHEILEDATEKAKEMLLSKFDGKLDGLMTDYQRNLDNVGKIYQSIAASMADKAGKDVTFKLG